MERPRKAERTKLPGTLAEQLVGEHPRQLPPTIQPNSEAAHELQIVVRPLLSNHPESPVLADACPCQAELARQWPKLDRIRPNSDTSARFGPKRLAQHREHLATIWEHRPKLAGGGRALAQVDLRLSKLDQERKRAEIPAVLANQPQGFYRFGLRSTESGLTSTAFPRPNHSAWFRPNLSHFDPNSGDVDQQWPVFGQHRRGFDQS